MGNNKQQTNSTIMNTCDEIVAATNKEHTATESLHEIRTAEIILAQVLWNNFARKYRECT